MNVVSPITLSVTEALFVDKPEEAECFRPARVASDVVAAAATGGVHSVMGDINSAFSEAEQVIRAPTFLTFSAVPSELFSIGVSKKMIEQLGL